MNHKWFENFSWEGIENQTIESPWKPNKEEKKDDDDDNDEPKELGSYKGSNNSSLIAGGSNHSDLLCGDDEGS